MKYFWIVFLLIFPVESPSLNERFANNSGNDPTCRKNAFIVKAVVHHDYQINISSSGDQLCRTLDILKNGETIYHDEEIGGYFYLGDDFNENENRESFLNLPESEATSLIVSKWTGGMHCCFSMFIFELGHDFKVVANIDGGNFQPLLKDLNGDGIPEVEITDDFLAYQFSSFAYSATAEVVLEYRNGTYEVMAEFMRKPAPDFEFLSRDILSWQKEFSHNQSGDYPPPKFIQAVTDLYYTGNKNLALEVIERSWPTSIPGKQRFIHEYESALMESRFYRKFEEQVY